MPEIHLTWEDIDKFMTVAAGSLEREWLNGELDKIKSGMKTKPKKNPNIIRMIDSEKRFHPLAYRIHRASEALRRLMGTPEPWETTEDIMKLVHLGRCISILKQNNVVGLDEKIKSLMSSNYRLFEKTVFELQTAASHCEAGHSVEFIDTQGVKFGQTPDLLVDGEIEVECKRKDAKSQRDAKNRQFWKKVSELAYGSMDRHGWNYSVFTKTAKDLKHSDVEFLVAEIDRIVAQREEGRFTYDDRGIELNVKMLLKKGEEAEPSEAQLTIDEEFDEIMPVGKTLVKSGRSVIIDQRVFAYRCLEPPDRVKSVNESVKDAISQFSGERPALVYVNLNTIHNSLEESDYRRLDSMICETLRNNSTVNAVIVVAEFLNHMKGGLDYDNRTRIVRNATPKRRLPQGFLIVGDSA